jgi:heme-degrading monooxygenase HmoA
MSLCDLLTLREPEHQHLAQFNVATIRYELDDLRMAGFVAALAPINALADRSQGFVWRLHDDTGNSTGIRPYPDKRSLVTLSVWENLEFFREFAYAGAHASTMAKRREWFEEIQKPYLVLWWIPRGCIPTVEEGVRRLELLRSGGPTPDAFSLAHSFPDRPSAAAAIPHQTVEDNGGVP